MISLGENPVFSECIPEYLDMGFPPKLKNMRDVVINQEAQEQLALEKEAPPW